MRGSVLGRFMGLCRGHQVPCWLMASRLQPMAFRVLLDARLLLITRCRLCDLLRCRWVLGWWRRWAFRTLGARLLLGLLLDLFKEWSLVG